MKRPIINRDDRLMARLNQMGISTMYGAQVEFRITWLHIKRDLDKSKVGELIKQFLEMDRKLTERMKDYLRNLVNKTE